MNEMYRKPLEKADSKFFVYQKIDCLMCKIHDKPLEKAARDFLYIKKSFELFVYKKSRTSQNTASVIFKFGIEIYNIFQFPVNKIVQSILFPVELLLFTPYLKTSNRCISTEDIPRIVVT